MNHATNITLTWIIFAAGVTWIGGTLATSMYANTRGYPFLPIFLCALFIPWPLVLLGVIIGEGPRVSRALPDEQQFPEYGTVEPNSWTFR
jgi:hypothetical protein